MAPQFPTLFLSHSGQQKGFVGNLYRELVHVKHSTFFDQDSGMDSLPKGSPYPPRILEACRECKLGLVVLSHDYIESLWPMLELQQLIFHNRNKPDNVYPIFYTLKPADLSRDENLERWRSTWQKKEASWQAQVEKYFTEAPSSSTSDPQPILDINSWPQALEKLRCQTGDILPNNKNEHSFIQTIVSNICKRFPPPQSFLMDNCWKGADHIPQEIHEVFQEEEERRRETDMDCHVPVVVGMHGVGGSGKSTVCKYMVNFYGKDYPGNCFCLEFPTKEEDESKSLVQSMKDVLSTRGFLAKEMLDSINSVNQALSHLQELLRRYKVFLILDNVWDWALQVVRQIVRMEFEPDSRLLVTARSAPLLKKLSMEEAMMSTMRIIHVPSMSEEEAIEALMAYSMTSWHFSSRVDDLRGLARSCFPGGQCHPLLLKGVGVKLRHVSGCKRSGQDWARLMSRLQSSIKDGYEDIETTVVSVLKTSYEQLRSIQLRDTFLKLGTCCPPQFRSSYNKYNLHTELCEWLAMISGCGFPTVDDIRDQIIELEYHGLVEIQGSIVKFHDLQMMLIDNLLRENNGEARRWVLIKYGSDGISTALSETSDDAWRRVKYIYGKAKHSIICEISERRWLNWFFPFDRTVYMSPRWQHIEVLRLENVMTGDRQSVKHVESLRLSVEHMGSLRHLVLKNFDKLMEVGGWHGAPNLTSVILCNCGLQKVESMTCLSRLEVLVISRSWSMNCGILKDANDLTEFLGHRPKLRELNLSYYQNNWVDLDRQLSANFPSLQRCTLANTEILKFPSMNLIQLRVLDLSYCGKLQSIEGSMCSLMALEELCLIYCNKLERIPDLKPLVSLRVLELRGCSALEEVKVGDAAPLTNLDLKGCHAVREMKVGDAAVTSLERLSLQYGMFCRLSGSSSSPLPIGAFTNLRWLRVDGGKGDPGSGLDLLRMDVPVSLVDLYLDGFETGNEITGLNRLLNLRSLDVSRCASLTSITGWQSTVLGRLYVRECASLTHITGLNALPNLRRLVVGECASLTSITGLALLTNLQTISIYRCESLRDVGHWEPPFDRYKLHSVRVKGCPQLEMSAFPFRIASPDSLQRSKSAFTRVGGIVILT